MNQNSIIRNRFFEIKRKLKKLDIKKISNYILNKGFFPEREVLPPSFEVKGFKLQDEPYIENLKDFKSKRILTIYYPKSEFTSRVFGIIHPEIYHDILYWIAKDWNKIIDHVFDEDLKIFSFSFPVFDDTYLTREGKMIHSWFEMAEKYVITEAYNYKYIIKTDVSNFYESVYTHAIAWALHGRPNSRGDMGQLKLLGSKLDKLFQYSNERISKGIPVGPILSDLVAEIILAAVDKRISDQKLDFDFIGTRFKDDYRILTHSEYEAKRIIDRIEVVLREFKLHINDKKTRILLLPNGLYREHIKEYGQYSLKSKDTIRFNEFELVLLKVFEINEKYPGTNLFKKFLSELYKYNKNNKKYELKVVFKNKIEIKKFVSLLFILMEKSPNCIGNILALIDLLYKEYEGKYSNLKDIIKEYIITKVKYAEKEKSVYKLIWFIFFSRFFQLGLDKELFPKFKDLNLDDNSSENIYKSMLENQDKLFQKSEKFQKDVSFFKKPSEFRKKQLIQLMEIFPRY